MPYKLYRANSLGYPAHEALEAGQFGQCVFTPMAQQGGVTRGQFKAAHYIQAVCVEVLQAAFNFNRFKAGNVTAQGEVSLAQLVVLLGFAAWINHYRQDAQRCNSERHCNLHASAQLQGCQCCGAAGDKCEAKQQAQQLVQLAVAVVELDGVVNIDNQFVAGGFNRSGVGHGELPHLSGGLGAGGNRFGLGLFCGFGVSMVMAPCVDGRVLWKKSDVSTGSLFFSRTAAGVAA